MLTIDNTQTVNQLVANVKDVNLSGSNTYLLKFINNQTHKEYFTLSVDQSTSGRYGQFLITSNINNPYSSSVILPENYYTYSIYESSNSGSVSSSLGLHIVDKGKLLVFGVSSSIQAYSGSDALTYYVYTGSI
jgi:hypothetical protein